MSRPLIEAFLIDDLNETKITAHGLSIRQIIQVLENRHAVIPNRKQRRGIYLVIGRDNGSASIAIPVEPTHESNVWRLITAWRCKDNEQTLLEKRER